jgi:type II secretory pathway pseudopilin PulG
MIELIVLVVAVSVAAAFLVPSLVKTKKNALRIRCLANLRQLDLALLAYGNDNSDRLPRMQSANWIWDLPTVVDTCFKTNGITRDVLYDPGNSGQNDDAFWNFGMTNSRPYRAIGYALTFLESGGLDREKQNLHTFPESYGPTRTWTPVENASQRILAAGVVISQSGENNTNQMSNYHWKDIPGPYAKPLRSSHLDRAGRFPTGDNVAVLDGSGHWVNFTNMLPRTWGVYRPVIWW